MNLLFWRKKEKTFNEALKEAASNEAYLQRVDKVSIPGTRLICIKNYNEYRESYDNLRDYLKSLDVKKYAVSVGDIVTVIRVNDHHIELASERSKSYRNLSFSLVEWQPYLFDYFLMEDEKKALDRENNLNKILK